MTEMMILGGMIAAAMFPFALLAYLARLGKAGWVLAALSLIGAVLAILFYAAGRPFGIDPVWAMGALLIVVLPGFLGGLGGAALGLLLRRRDDQRRQG